MKAAHLFWRDPLRLQDAALLMVMAALAACGLIYEYLLAHFAGRILGAVEATIFAMIGAMIVSMGLGSFYAKRIRCAFTGFAWLEASIGLLGATSALVMAAVYSAAYVLPITLQRVYGIDSSIDLPGGISKSLNTLAEATPYVMGVVVGFLVGMEIPLIARVREIIHGEHLVHNTGTIYGADYIGAGVGAAIWVLVCLRLPIIVAAIGTASVNVLMGMFFLWRYGKRLRHSEKLWLVHAALTALLILLAICGPQWMQGLNDMLFRDRVVFSRTTEHQQITITKRQVGSGLPQVWSLYLNGRLQFASNDEHIYHSMLTYPALLASARHDRVLVIGGGDGLAVRDILKWQPKSVVLVELDPAMIELFSGRDTKAPQDVSEHLVTLNEAAFDDPRVNVVFGDAFLKVEGLISKNRHFDTVIVDLPDPNHPNLNKLYSNYFYAKLRELLSGDGALVVQSTSPYHAKKAFVSIGKTVQSAGFITEQYHTNVPSFGEWGWTIGTVSGEPASERIADVTVLPVDDSWVSPQQLLAAFVFSPHFYDHTDGIRVNSLDSNVVYQYHLDGWMRERGIFFTNNVDLRH